MAKVYWTGPARKDLDEIADYISQNSPTIAQSVVTRITESTKNLMLFPRMGRVVPELNDDSVRELIVYRYRVIYRISRRGVAIWAVIHGARDLRNALQGRTI